MGVRDRGTGTSFMPLGCVLHPLWMSASPGGMYPSGDRGHRSCLLGTPITPYGCSRPWIAGIPPTEADTDQGKGCAPPREGVTGPRDGAILHTTWVRATR